MTFFSIRIGLVEAEEPEQAEDPEQPRDAGRRRWRLANSTNWFASRAWETGKFVISRSWVSSGDTCTRSATPRRSGSVSA